MSNSKSAEFPTIDQIRAELQKEQSKHRFGRTLRNTVFLLIVVVAVAVIIAVMLLPVLKISGSSMTETLHDGEVVVAVNGSHYDTGDIIAFYYNNNVLVKRVIANAGDWVDIDEDGNVFVNDKKLDEPYVNEKALGDCNIKLPYQVPEGKCFVMGDHRATSIDSRNSAIGCVDSKEAMGKIVFCVWPLNSVGLVN